MGMNFDDRQLYTTCRVYTYREGKTWERIGMTIDKSYYLIRRKSDFRIYYTEAEVLDHRDVKEISLKSNLNKYEYRRRHETELKGLRSRYKGTEFRYCDVSNTVHQSTLQRGVKTGILVVSRREFYNCRFNNVYRFADVAA